MTHDQKQTLNAVVSWVWRAFVGIVVYLAIEVRGKVEAMQAVDAQRATQIEILKTDLSYIRATLLRIENRLERTQ